MFCKLVDFYLILFYFILFYFILFCFVLFCFVLVEKNNYKKYSSLAIALYNVFLCMFLWRFYGQENATLNLVPWNRRPWERACTIFSNNAAWQFTKAPGRSTTKLHKIPSQVSCREFLLSSQTAVIM